MFTGTLIVAVAICSLALLGITAIAYARRKHFLQKEGFSQVVQRYYLKGSSFTEGQQDLFLALLCYEDRYPSFAAVLEKITPKFPLSYFARHPEFVHALDSLTDLSNRGMDDASARMVERAALATVIRIVVEDPYIHQTYGRDLEPLVDRFIQEIGINVPWQAARS